MDGVSKKGLAATAESPRTVLEPRPSTAPPRRPDAGGQFLPSSRPYEKREDIRCPKCQRKNGVLIIRTSDPSPRYAAAVEIKCRSSGCGFTQQIPIPLGSTVLAD